jgi:prepilin-type N-terminal cleavage/methylation domain-containing protein
MRADKGFSLIELLIAMVVTLIVLGLTFRAFADALKVNDSIRLMTDVNQNLQSASTYLIRDLVDTGRNFPATGISLPQGGSAVIRPGPALAAAAGYPSTVSLVPLIPGDAKGPTIGQFVTDTITTCAMDGVLGSMTVTTLTVTASSSTIVLDPATVFNTRPEDTIAAGDLIYLLNDKGNTLQRVTAIDKATRTITFADSDAMKLNQPTLATGGVKALSGGAGTVAQRLFMTTYYIDNSGATPMLMRQDNIKPAVAVALGVTNFQVSYNAVDGAGVTAITNVVYPTYSANQVDQGFIALAARSDRAMANTKTFITNNMVTQVGFRSLSTRQDYFVGP